MNHRLNIHIECYITRAHTRTRAQIGIYILYNT